MFCCNCGNQLNPNAVVCVACGVATQNFMPFTHQISPGIPKPDDQAGSGWGLFGFFMMYVTAIAPLILICVWRNDYPKRTKSIFYGVLTSLIVNFTAVIICVFIVVLLTAGILDDNYLALLWFMIAIYAGIIFFSLSIWGVIVSIIYTAIKK